MLSLWVRHWHPLSPAVMSLCLPGFSLLHYLVFNYQEIIAASPFCQTRWLILKYCRAGQNIINLLSQYSLMSPRNTPARPHILHFLTSLRGRAGKFLQISIDFSAIKSGVVLWWGQNGFSIVQHTTGRWWGAMLVVESGTGGWRLVMIKLPRWCKVWWPPVGPLGQHLLGRLSSGKETLDWAQSDNFTQKYKGALTHWLTPSQPIVSPQSPVSSFSVNKTGQTIRHTAKWFLQWRLSPVWTGKISPDMTEVVSNYISLWCPCQASYLSSLSTHVLSWLQHSDYSILTNNV